MAQLKSTELSMLYEVSVASVTESGLVPWDS
jgi:hypothetical protein